MKGSTVLNIMIVAMLITLVSIEEISMGHFVIAMLIHTLVVKQK